MRIFVCVKQTAAPEGRVERAPGGTLDRAQSDVGVNFCDLHAVEAAIRWKETLGGRVTVISMGPEGAVRTLRDYLAMGADDAVLVTDPIFAGADTYATARVLAAALRAEKIGTEDLILCGAQSADGMTAQVGPQLAEALQMPCMTFADEIALENGRVLVRRETEGGSMRLGAETPCVVTCARGMNEPRRATVAGIFACENKPVRYLHSRDLALPAGGGPRIEMLSLFSPRRGEKSVVFQGTEEEAVGELVRRLRQHQII